MVKRLWVMGLSLLMGLGLAQPKTEVTFLYGLGGRLGEIIRATVDTFNKRQNEVAVRAEFANSYEGVLQKALAGIAAGQPAADILQLEVALWPRLAAAGQLTDLSALPGFKPMFDSFWGVFKLQADPDKDGKVFATPWNNSNPVTYYNPELLKKAGYSAPPRTWPEMREFARKVKEVTGVPAMALPAFPWVLEGAVWSNGGEIVGKDRLLLDQPAALEVINAWTQLIRDGSAVVENANTTQDFVAGKVAITFQSVASRPGIKALAGERFAQIVRVAPLPYFKKPVVPVGGATLAISRGIPQERVLAAWKFIQWLNRPEQQLEWIKQTNYVPITRSTSELPAFRAFLATEQGLDVGMRQLPNARPRPTEPGYVQGIQEIKKTLEDIWLNNKPVEPAIRELVQRTQPLFAN